MTAPLPHLVDPAAGMSGHDDGRVPQLSWSAPAGSDHAARPLLLGPSLGTSTALWNGCLPALRSDRRVVRWDLPGHGAAAGPRPAPGEVTLDGLADAVLALADGLGIGVFDHAGVSLGGAVGLRLAARHPERVGALALVCSAARFPTPAAWRERAALVRARGTAAVVEASAARWFTERTRATRPDLVAGLLDQLRHTDARGYAACCDVLATLDLRPDLAAVRCPVLVVAGAEDVATPPALARELAAGLPRAATVVLAGAAHLAVAERPDAVADSLLAHLRSARSERGHPCPRAHGVETCAETCAET